jgi:hypothetical protein
MINQNLTNMKKQLSLFVATLATLFLTLSASAQGEWKWANYWTGNDDPLNSTNPYNYVVRTAFDDDGNVYVFGSFGGNARLYDQNMSTWISDNVAVATSTTQGIILTKFDSLGNYSWSRIIKTIKNESCRPYDMVLYDNQILIAGEYSFTGSLGEQLMFLDTLITQQTAQSYPSGQHQPPYTYGSYSFFSVLDLDGNVLDNHFMKTLTRELYNGQPGQMALADGNVGARPICLDSQGNVYIAVNRYYGGVDTLPFTLVIDEDPLKTYPLFLPGNCYGTNVINNMMLYKFTPSWELGWMRLVIDSTEGISPAIPVDTINPYIRQHIGGLSIDENDKLYLSGYLMDMWIHDEQNQYPMYIYWDSTHYATIADQSLAKSLPFIIKYDSDGNVQWANQAYVKNEPSTDFYNFMVWHDNFVDDGGVYIIGQAGSTPEQNPLFYFDNETNHITLLPNTYQHTSFFVKYDKETGGFDALGQTPGLHTFAPEGQRPAVLNNHLLGMFQNNFSQGSLLCYFNTNGHFVKTDTMFSNDESQQSLKTIVNEKGTILCDFICKQNINFGHDLTLNFDDHQYSHAVIAYRSDPSILEPYPEDSVGITQHKDIDSPIKIYPNPTKEILNLENENSPIENVMIYTTAGKELIQQEPFESRCSINVSALPNGVYLVKTICDGEAYFSKFVKTDF